MYSFFTDWCTVNINLELDNAFGLLTDRNDSEKDYSRFFCNGSLGIL